MSFTYVIVGNNAALCPKKVGKKADLISHDRSSIELKFWFLFLVDSEPFSVHSGLCRSQVL